MKVEDRPIDKKSIDRYEKIKDSPVNLPGDALYDRIRVNAQKGCDFGEKI